MPGTSMKTRSKAERNAYSVAAGAIQSSPSMIDDSILHPGPRLPELPNEIWLMIFDLATRTGGSRIEHYPPYTVPALPVEFIDAQYIKRREESIGSRYLRLVCRNWCQLANPIFWRTFELHHPKQFEARTKIKHFREALEISGLKGSDGGIGRFIRELSLDVYNLTPQDLDRILPLCSGLKQLRVRHQTRWESAAFPERLSLPKTLTSLGAVSLATKGSHLPTRFVELINASNVTCFDLREVSYKGRYPTKLHLPSITTLRLSPATLHWVDFVTVAATWHLPSLRHLALYEFDDLLQNSMLRRFGSQLRSLEVNGCGSSWSNVMSALPSMPELRELVLGGYQPQGMFDPENDYAWARPQPTAVVSSVTHLGVGGDSMTADLWMSVLKTILVAKWPDLMCLRLCPCGGEMEGLEKVREFEEACRKAGLAVEDEYGHDIFID